MLTRYLHGATLYYGPADVEAVADLERDYEDVRRVMSDDWQLAPTRHLKIRFITSWRQVGMPGWLGVLGRWFLLPLRWYTYAFAGLWRHYQADAWFAGRNRAGVNVKPLRLLPTNKPLQLRASFEQDEPDFDQRTAWRFAFCRDLIAAWYANRLPAWVLVGLHCTVARQVIDYPWYEPRELGPILRCAGVDLKVIDLRKLMRYSQAEIDEISATHQWQRYVLGYLRAEHGGLLRELLASDTDPHAFNDRLAAGLGLPGNRLFSELARRVEQWSTIPGEEPMPRPAEASGEPVAVVELSDNPYASPTTAAGSTTEADSAGARASQRTAVVAAVIALLLPAAWYWQWDLVPIILGFFVVLWLAQVALVAGMMLVDLARGMRYGGPK